MRKRIIFFLIATILLVGSGCGNSASTESFESRAEANVLEAYSQTESNARSLLQENDIHYIYYTEYVNPGNASSEHIFYKYGSSDMTKYTPLKGDFNSAIEWYKYTYEKGPIAPNDQHKANLDMWVKYLSWHEEAIPILTEKKNLKGLYKYIKSEAGDKSYEPKEWRNPPYDTIEVVFVVKGDFTFSKNQSGDTAYIVATFDKHSEDEAVKFRIYTLFDGYSEDSSSLMYLKEDLPSYKRIVPEHYTEKFQAINESA